MTTRPALRLVMLVAALGIAAALPASGAAEMADDAGVQVDLNKGVWVRGPDLPSPRQDAAVAVMGGRIYLVGGFGARDRQMASLLVLEPTFPSPEAKPDVAGPITSHPGEWRAAATMPEPVDHAAAAGLGGYLYVAGGRVEDLVTNKFWRYDPVEDVWSELPSMPYPRYGPMLQAVGGKLYLFGGQSAHGNDETSLMIFDPATNEWKTEPYGLGYERFLAASVVLNGKVYIVGGRGREQVNLRTCDIYDPLRDRWGTCGSLRQGRSDFGLAVVNSRLMAIGGENLLTDTNTQTTEISVTDARGWMNGPWLPSPRHGMAVAALGNQIWVIGGSPYVGTGPTTTVLRYVSPVTKIKFKGRVKP